MAILVDSKTRVLIQGITGAEGSRACREMLGYGTKVIAGVTPGKGGQKVEGVPVYDTVAQAVAKHPEINTSLIVTPAGAVKDAALEAMAHDIPLLNILAEHVSPIDTSMIVAVAKKRRTRVVGPSSVGIMSPGIGKLGSIGSGETKNIFSKGHVGVVSKSGGLTGEIAVILSRAGIGQSTAVGIGGDTIEGSDFVDILELFEKDKETWCTVIFGEVGGTSEERVAEYVAAKKLKKPIVAVIGGEFTTHLPQGVVLGHAGAIVSHGKGGYASKIRTMKKAGIIIAKTLEEIPDILKKITKNKL